ncbi:MAG: ABC transporter ATP-binding protein, partial [Bdellovibrionota bacterium]
MSSHSLITADSLALRAQPFRYYMRKHPRAFLIGVGSLLLTNGFDVLTPLVLKFGIDAVTEKDMAKLGWAIAFYAFVMVNVMIFRFGWRVFFGKFHHTVAEDLRNRIFSKLTELGPSFYQRSPVGQLMSLLTNDVNSFRMAIGGGMVTLIDSISLMAITLPLMIWLSWDWTWQTLVFIPFVPFVMRRLEKLVHEYYRIEQDRLAELSGRAQEIISGIRPIKSFAQEENQLASFNVLSRRYEHACNRMAFVDTCFHPTFKSAMILGTASLLWFGTPDVIRGTATLGSFVAFYEYVKRLVWPLSAIGLSASMIEQGRASFDRIGELLATDTDIPDSGSREIAKFEKLELKNLTFRYPNSISDALTDVSLTIHAGETIGIVGPVGAGKTTLLQLICRMFPAPAGSVRINGVDVSDIKRSSLTETVSYVTQDVLLFSESIAQNVALGIPAFPGLEPIAEAARVVNIDDEIQNIPSRYDALLGERGVNLSGGQKQRLTIARAIIRRSSLVMLDDSLSA